MSRRNAIAISLAVLLAAALTLAACTGGNPYGGSGTSSGGGGSTPASGGAAGAGTTVTEQGFAFNPTSLTVKVGDTVTFTNEDSAPHDVKIDGQSLGEQAQGQSVTWKAAKAGTFPYACTIHPTMTGEIVVK